jgi:very-short-patch-repair endonuclease
VAPVRKEVTRNREANLVLEAHLRELKISFLPEFKFCPDRDWRADYQAVGAKGVFLLEIEGAVWTQGRHTRGAGYLKDLDKYRTAAALGYKVFRFSTQEVLNGTAKAFLEKWA